MVQKYGDAVVITNVAQEAYNSTGTGAKDFIDAVIDRSNNLEEKDAVNALNSAANMGELAGVNHGTYTMSNTMTDAVAHHLSLANLKEEADKDIWAHYVHSKEDVEGLALAGVKANYDAQYNGIVVGSDLYKNGKTTGGVALSYADGNINSTDSAVSTKNEAEYYGVSFYARTANADSAVLYDLSYMHSENDITQRNSGKTLTASPKADAFSVGVRVEKAMVAGAGNLVPYAGLRYMRLGTGAYENNIGLKYDLDDQNLWLLPVGVSYSVEEVSGDWKVRTILDAGYVWAMGDTDARQTVSLGTAHDSFGFDTTDDGSFVARLGIAAEKANVTYGIAYEYQKGDSVQNSKWMANLAWNF